MWFGIFFKGSHMINEKVKCWTQIFLYLKPCLLISVFNCVQLTDWCFHTFEIEFRSHCISSAPWDWRWVLEWNSGVLTWAPFLLPFLSLFLFYSYLYVFMACTSTYHVPAQCPWWGHWIPCNWSYKWLWAATWALGTNQ